MNLEGVKRYQANKKELNMIERSLKRLYVQLESLPDVAGKVSKSSDDFPYIEEHVTVRMREPKRETEIKDRIRRKERRKKILLADMAEAERAIAGMPEGVEREIFELVYLDGMSQYEVGRMIGYTQSMISKVISNVMKDS